MKEEYSIKAFQLWGVPVFVHRSIPIVFLLVGLIAPRYLVDGSALMLLLFLHEVGHLVAARLTGVNSSGIYLFWFYGFCVVEEFPSRRKELICYTAGIIAQLFVLLLTLGLGILFRPEGRMPWFLERLTYVLIPWNLLLILLNLLPIYPLDGWFIWGRHLKESDGNSSRPVTISPKTSKDRGKGKILQFPSKKETDPE